MPVISIKPLFPNNELLLKKIFWLVLIVFTFSHSAHGDSTPDAKNIDNANHRLQAESRNRLVESDATWASRYINDVKPLLDSRCVVCHGCYDAPCQLKLSSPEGIERGASKEQIYDGRRLLETKPSRLFVDADNTAEWREKGFFTVLNEFRQTPDLNRRASILYHMLRLKQANPLPDTPLLSDEFTLDLQREQQCPKPEEFSRFRERYPLWGMPYGLPGIEEKEAEILISWLEAGSPYPAPTPLPTDLKEEILQWETLLNGQELKQRLINRYIYEHLFLADIYFPDIEDELTPHFFELVRSTTPPGQPIAIIKTRRPYDDPGADQIYYRLRLNVESISEKTHMAYALTKVRREKWNQWFYQAPFEVTDFPSYNPNIASNPFVSFQQLPADSRYRFMLEEAEFTIMGFIKGPVCRGQVALNVIRDRFWVFFKSPNIHTYTDNSAFLAKESHHLRLPAEAQSTLRPFGHWLDYSHQQSKWLKAKYKSASQLMQTADIKLDQTLAWDGDGTNANAALTVFRHFDSASVVKGWVGSPPKTLWMVDYPILERIHYLLVAGFDVYGNVGHQLLTRLYMDFLRMESEFNFLVMLPRDRQVPLWDEWYEDADDDVLKYVKRNSKNFYHSTNINYQTPHPKQELITLLHERLNPILTHSWDINQPSVPQTHQRWLNQISYLPGSVASLLPQTIILSVSADTTTHASPSDQVYTLIHNNAHANISSLLDEESNRRPEHDDITVVKGILGSYPSAFWHVPENQLEAMVTQLARIRTEEDYVTFMNRYAIRRTSQFFWQHSDNLHRIYQQQAGIRYGLLDYSRLENR